MSMNWFWNRCRRQQAKLSLLASGVLSESERIEIERHLVSCADCRSHYDQIKIVTASLAIFRGSMTDCEPSPAARQHWAQAIRAARSSPSLPLGVRGSDLGNRPKPSFARLCGQLFWPCRHAWGAIAVAWFVMWAVNWGQPATGDAARPQSANRPAITQTFAEEQRLLAQLIPPFDRDPAEAPPRKPLPHSEAQTPWLIG